MGAVVLLSQTCPYLATTLSCTDERFHPPLRVPSFSESESSTCALLSVEIP